MRVPLMPSFTTSRLTGLAVATLAAALAAGSCGGDRPTAPDPLQAPATAAQAEGNVTARKADDGNSPPNVIFKTDPAANDDGVIMGGSSIDVKFNLCASSDPDPGDTLR